MLPQFILDEDINRYNELARRFADVHEDRSSRRIAVRILTYGSFAASPRLLTTRELTLLATKISKIVDKMVKLTIIDPKVIRESSVRRGNVVVKYVRWLPKRYFLRELVNADLYIERNLDEELGYAALEAALMGTPIGKITLPQYLSRQDYTSKEILVSTSFSDFVNKVKEYIMNLDYYRKEYSRNVRKFIITRRVWDVVKEPLISLIKKRSL